MDNDNAWRPARAFLKQLLRIRSGRFGLFLVLVLVFLSLFAPLVVPFSPLEMNRGDEFAPPSARYIFGTDQFGRDIFSRVLFGGRISLLVGFGSIGVAALIGVGSGLIAGYLPGNGGYGYHAALGRAARLSPTFFWGSLWWQSWVRGHSSPRSRLRS